MYVHRPIIAGQPRPVGTLTADKTRAEHDVGMRVECIAHLACIFTPIAGQVGILRLFVLPNRWGDLTRRLVDAAEPCGDVCLPLRSIVTSTEAHVTP